MISTEEMLDAIKGDMLLGEPMAKHTSLKIGGPADFYVDPLDKDDLIRAIALFEANKLPYHLVGRGTNLLVHDKGVCGAVIATSRALGSCTIQGTMLRAGAGVLLPTVAKKSFAASLGGLELLQGIPGTVGGAIAMNAGAYGQDIAAVLSGVEILENGAPRMIPAEEIVFGYRRCSLEKSVILGAVMKLKKLSAAERGRRDIVRREVLKKRRASQPLSWPNAGSVFRNPSPGNNPSGLTAGQMIEACGLKGCRKGDAKISEAHANIIINTGAAKAADVMGLIGLMREHVQKMFGVSLELELRLLGYEEPFG